VPLRPIATPTLSIHGSPQADLYNRPPPPLPQPPRAETEMRCDQYLDSLEKHRRPSMAITEDQYLQRLFQQAFLTQIYRVY
jgi:hypothetical protein